MDSNNTTRRNWLKSSALGIGALLGAGLAGESGARRFGPSVARGADSVAPARAGSLRVAHMTDVHVQPELGAGRGLAACLHHVQSLAEKPAMILNTGDCVMDSFAAGRDRTEIQWELWQKVLKDECSLPIAHCLGNHDIWGWDKIHSKTAGDEPLYGKKRALEALGLAKPYHSFDRSGWHFVMLDSVARFNESSYCARLDEEQMAWLESDLAATRPETPVLIASHIPILSPAAVLTGSHEDKDRPGQLGVGGGVMHLDSPRLAQLFLKHPNVKLCISGHLHLVDRADYRGVTYLSNPAVSGNWWKGKHMGVFGEQYTLLDLHPDGSFYHQYVSYGWTAEAK